MMEGKLIIIPSLGHQSKETSTSQAWMAFVLMSQRVNNNELALQHGGFCTMWSFVAKGLLERSLKKSELRTSDVRDTGAMLYQLSYEATHWERGHGFESRWSPDFFRLLLSNCLNWEINCDDHSSLSSTSAVQIWITSYILQVIWLARWKNAKEGQAMRNQSTSWPFPFSAKQRY